MNFGCYSDYIHPDLSDSLKLLILEIELYLIYLTKVLR